MREWTLKNSQLAELFCRKLLAHGREFHVICLTGGVLFHVRDLNSTMREFEFPNPEWLIEFPNQGEKK